MTISENEVQWPEIPYWVHVSIGVALIVQGRFFITLNCKCDYIYEMCNVTVKFLQ